MEVVGVFEQKASVDRVLRKLGEPVKRKKWAQTTEHSPIGNERRPKYYAQNYEMIEKSKNSK